MDNTELHDNQYLMDIVSQPAALANALDCLDLTPLEALTARRDEFDRVLLTGMGASFYALYPAWLHLARAGLPALWMDTAELVHYARELVTQRTLLCVASQSGRSAEVVALLERFQKGAPGALLAITNDLESPLAKATDLYAPICAETEHTVSTRTYLNTLAITQLWALSFCDQDLEPYLRDLRATIAGLSGYLSDWEARLGELRAAVGAPRHLVLMGRGPSLASAYSGALIIQEAAKFPAMGIGSGEFRHGPIEIAGPDLTALLFAGPRETRGLNLRLFNDLREYGAEVFWLEAPNMFQDEGWESPEPPFKLMQPAASGIGLPIAEMLPIQLISVHLVLEAGLTPGTFHHIGKVTLEE